MNIKEINKYYDEAKEKWGNTSEYKEYEEKSKNRTKQEFEDINDRFISSNSCLVLFLLFSSYSLY